ncbi:isopropylmalate isomerase [Thioclava kandeliae]|uniref:Isopropylmalate isomerase n=1 Tax=Thioclava kandeliae TaxID=3070818 RepID=A0ABV1SMP1_9RHOB
MFGTMTPCVAQKWSPGIGDPTILGWSTVLAYFVVCMLCIAAARVKKEVQISIFFVSIAVILLFLTINKQLDLQSALTAYGKCLAKAQGWYNQRRTIQVEAIYGIIAAAVALGLALGIYFRRIWSQIWLALLGLAVLIGFIAIRALSFHHMDQLITSHIAGLRLNGVFELTGIGLIGLNALWVIRRWSS